MSWQIPMDALAKVIVLDGELFIENAAESHQAALSLYSASKPVRKSMWVES